MNPLQFPKLEKYVNDFSQIFDAQKVEELSTLFQNHETATTEQVITILFPHRQGNELLDIWLKVFNENGIGQKDTNNGLLLIIATEEKKLRIVVGKWLEYKYTDNICKDLIETKLRPLLNEGKYEDLIREWYYIVSNFEKENSTPLSKNWNTEIPKWFNFIFLIIVIFIIITTIIGIFSGWFISEAFPILFWGIFSAFWLLFTTIWWFVRKNWKQTLPFLFIWVLFFFIGISIVWEGVNEVKCIWNNSQQCVELRSNISKKSTNNWHSSSSSSSHFSWWGGWSHGGGAGD